jgi:hypothetical protein
MNAQATPELESDAPETVRGSLIRRIRGEYEEMPGLTLTVRQAARLWAVDVEQSQRVLSALVASRFLVRDPSGTYHRPGCPRCS